MGTFKKGILGSFSGKVGSVVGTQWKGITVIRSRPGSRKKGSFSQKQLEQQARFGQMMNFLQPLSALLNQTFDSGAKSMSGFNKAFSFNIIQAIAGTFPDFSVDYSKVQLSRGNLNGAGSASCASPIAGKLVFSWTDNGNGLAPAGDLAFLAAYSKDTNQWVYSLGSILRSAATATLDVGTLSAKAVQTYLGFISADGRFASNSNYTGMVTVS